jgi:hypothetical protein
LAFYCYVFMFCSERCSKVAKQRSELCCFDRVVPLMSCCKLRLAQQAAKALLAYQTSGRNARWLRDFKNPSVKNEKKQDSNRPVVGRFW